MSMLGTNRASFARRPVGCSVHVAATCSSLFGLNSAARRWPFGWRLSFVWARRCRFANRGVFRRVLDVPRPLGT
eukprot:2963885-Alexandrium_andersonii.AAC.1